MKENVNKLFVRGDRLDELSERSENLRSAADEFQSASARSAWDYYMFTTSNKQLALE